jgi:hypothetical protein
MAHTIGAVATDLAMRNSLMPAPRLVAAAVLALVVNTTSFAQSPANNKVLILGIDGCRTDALRRANTPNLDQLIREGAMADTTSVVAERDTGADTVSGPSWSSILTGVWTDKHGVKDNSFRGANYDEYPHFFRRLKDARPGAVTVSLVDWAPIHDKIVSAADV